MWVTSDGRINLMAFDITRTDSGKKMRKLIRRMTSHDREAFQEHVFELDEMFASELVVDDLDIDEEARFENKYVPDAVIDKAVEQIIASKASVGRVESIVREVDVRWRMEVLAFLDDCFD